jgi:hypothetical protein
MVPHLLFAAEKKVKDEFLLASIAMKAVKKMHEPGTRTEETASRVFEIVAKGHSVEIPTKTRTAETPSPSILETALNESAQATESKGRVQPPAA